MKTHSLKEISTLELAKLLLTIKSKKEFIKILIEVQK